MTVETSEFRSIMLADFGVNASYTPLAGGTVTVKGIFDNDYQAYDAGGSVSFALQVPRFFCKTESIPEAQEGDQMVIGAVSYVIRVVMPDGTGMTELALEKQ
jgi:hypothetical protein